MPNWPGSFWPSRPSADLTGDQRASVERVMRDILAPLGREDVNEVMDIVQPSPGPRHEDQLRLAAALARLPEVNASAASCLICTAWVWWKCPAAWAGDEIRGVVKTFFGPCRQGKLT
jgi:hypothetical protein